MRKSLLILLFIKNSKEYEEKIKKCHTRAGERMVKTCIKNGGIYVKLGQAISSMNEILPRELCNSLRVLQTQALRSEGYDVIRIYKSSI